MNTKIKIRKFRVSRVRLKEETLDLTNEKALSVDKNLLRGNKILKSLILPSMLCTVKNGAFSNCRSLKTVTLPKENGVGLSTAVFAGCTSLTHVENSQQITSIGKNAFAECVSLTEISFGDPLRKIGETAFRGCKQLKKIQLSNRVATLGKGVFRNCASLEQVTLEEGRKQLSDELFSGCVSLKTVEIPFGIETVPKGLFRGCSALEQIVLPPSVKAVEASAFRECSSLNRLELCLGVKKLGAMVFLSTPKLTSIAIPHSVKRLGFGAFGLGFSKEKLRVEVENEYMKRRMRRLLFLCGSGGRTVVVQTGKTIEERKRERRRATVEQTAVHLTEL